MTAIPEKNVPHSYASGSLELATGWIAVGDNEKASHLASAVAQSASEYLAWYSGLPIARQASNANEILYYFYQLNDAIKILDKCDEKQADIYDLQLRSYSQALEGALQD